MATTGRMRTTDLVSQRQIDWHPLDDCCCADYQVSWEIYAGTYADYSVSKGEWLAKAPKGILLNILGGVPLVALTAFQVTFQDKST